MRVGAENPLRARDLPKELASGRGLAWVFSPAAGNSASRPRCAASSHKSLREIADSTEKGSAPASEFWFERWMGSGLVVAERQLRRIVEYRALDARIAVGGRISKKARATNSAALCSQEKKP